MPHSARYSLGRIALKYDYINDMSTNGWGGQSFVSSPFIAILKDDVLWVLIGGRGEQDIIVTQRYRRGGLSGPGAAKGMVRY